MVEANGDEGFSDEEENQMTPEQAKEALFIAVKANNVEDVKALLDKGQTNATVEKDGWNPLLWASCNGNEEMVRLLIRNQAHTPYQKSQKMLDDSNNQDKSQAALNTDEVYDPFTKPPDSQKVGKYTPLHWAAYKGHIAVVQILMNAELDPRSIDVHGNNAVHQAAAASQIQVMKLFMSAGVDLEVPNDRGHYPIDLATDIELKNLILKSRKEKTCKGKNCGGSKFDFQNTRFYCQDCDRFFCKRCCHRYRVYENTESALMEKPVCRCDNCLATITDCEQRLKQAMETSDFATVDKVFTKIVNDKVDIDVMLKKEAERLHLRLEKELDIRNFIKSVTHVDNYKTIRKSVKILTEKQEKAEKLGVVLDPYLVNEINQCVLRLFSERDLRYEMDNTEVPSCSHSSVEYLEGLIKKAEDTNVEIEYLDAANKLKTKMRGNIQAREILEMLVEYPIREYPEPEQLDKSGKPIKKDDKKPKKKKKKEPPFPLPEWATELEAVQKQVRLIDQLSKQSQELHLTKDFLSGVDEQIKRFKKEIQFRRAQEEEARLEAEAKALAKKKAAAAKKK